MDYALLALAALMLAVDFAINKLYQRKAGTGLLKGLKFNALHGLCSTVVFLVATGFRIRFSLFSVLMASAFSLQVSRLPSLTNIISYSPAPKSARSC